MTADKPKSDNSRFFVSTLGFIPFVLGSLDNCIVFSPLLTFVVIRISNFSASCYQINILLIWCSSMPSYFSVILDLLFSKIYFKSCEPISFISSSISFLFIIFL